jgi:hypothetical protein
VVFGLDHQGHGRSQGVCAVCRECVGSVCSVKGGCKRIGHMHVIYDSCVYSWTWHLFTIITITGPRVRGAVE